jgi:lipoprotein-releasing system ATP-binding protein
VRSEAPLFTAEEVVKCYRDASGAEVVALRLAGRPLEIRDGVTVLLGPSGVGKSTLLSLLGGLDVPSHGVLSYRGEALPGAESAGMQAHRAHHVALVFQSLNLITHLSALDNAALPLVVRGVSRVKALARARRNLKRVGIGEELLDRLPAQLSGGQQQRVAVARAFTADAEVILADEPTGSLDPETAAAVMKVFARQARRTGRPVVLVTHNTGLARKYADRIVRLTAHGYEEVRSPRVAASGKGCRPAREETGRPRMGWTNRLRYAFSDLRHRRTSTAVTVLAVGIAALYTLLVGFAGERIDHANRETLGRVTVTRVVALTPQVTDTAHRFTPRKIAEMEGWPEVRLAFPCVEFNAEVALGAGKAEMLPLAATVPGDPSLALDRLHWGTGVAARDSNEVVLGRRLFERLGGRLAPGPLPAELDLQIARHMGGRGEVQRIRARIAGVLRNTQEEKVYLPLETVARLNLWREGKLVDPGGLGRASQVEYPFCLAYSPPAQDGRAREELEHYTLRGEKVRTLEVTEATGPIWADVAVSGVPAAARESLRRLANVRTPRVLTGTLGGRTAVVLAPEDDRWALLPREAALGQVGTRAGVAPPPLAEGYRLPESFPAKGDLVCTPETLGWLSFEPRSPRAERFALVRTRSLEAGAALVAEVPGRVRADVEEGWLFLRPMGAMGAILPRELAALRRSGAADVEAVAEGSVKVLADPDSGAFRSVPVRVLPDGLFARVVTRRPRRGRIACVYVSPRVGRAPLTLEVGEQRLEVCDERSGPVESLWISSSDAAAVCPDARPTGAAVWGRWETLLRARQAAASAGWSIDVHASLLPGRFTALVPGRGDAWARRLSLGAGDVTEVCGVPDVREMDGRRLIAVAATDIGEGGDWVRVGGEPAGRRTLSLRVAETTWERIGAMGDPDLPPGLLVVGERLFREIAFRAAGSPVPPTEAHETLACDDPLAYATAERLLVEQGVTLEPLTAVRRRTLVEYKVTDGKAAEGKVKPEVVQLLRTLPPAFEAAQAQVTVDALLAGGRVSCTGSDATDLRRFGCRLNAGGWLPREGGRHVVLPASLASRYGTSVGGEVLLRFPRSDGGRSESVALPVKVAGVTEDDGGVRLPGRLVEEVLLWKAGLLEFNEASLEFESPVESSLRQGHVRCNLYAAGPDEVAPLVRRLQALGYHTEDRLAEQEGVRELGRVLVAVVVFFVFGCVLISAITVWLTTTLNLQSKTWEIGILRSLGLPARDVRGIFLVQGLLMGLTAFLGALAIFAAVQNLFRAKVAQVLAIKEPAFLEGGPFEPSVLWLPAVVALVAVGFSVLGVMVPSLRACRLIPAEALRRRE